MGALRGIFSVSDAGSAEYAVPIEVPPGRAGIQPALSLKYFGSKANGDAGVGWMLDGLPKITRCPRIYALDGYAAPVRSDRSDRFCIDGKRLTAVNGTYGDHNTEYRTVIDTFAKIRSFREGSSVHLMPTPTANQAQREALDEGPDRFEVRTKDGKILTFGGTADSIMMGRNGTRFSWMLRRVEDRAQNAMAIFYDNQAEHLSGAELMSARPKLIDYTGGVGGAGNRSVRFSYEQRNDAHTSYLQGGLPWHVGQRLSKITTYLGDQPVRNYRLEYNPDGALSQIQKIFECEGDANARCKTPTRFEYEQESGFTFSEFGSYDLAAAVQLDVNNDGAPDFLQTLVSVDAVSAHPELAAAIVVADAGLIALTAVAPGPGSAISFAYNFGKIVYLGGHAASSNVEYTRNLYLGNGRGSPPTLVSNVQGLPCSPGQPMAVMDYDRDGNDDLVGSCEDRMGDAFVWSIDPSFSTANGHFQGASPVLQIVGTKPATQYRLPPPIFYDVNGDSLPDIVSCSTSRKIELRLRKGPGSQGFSDKLEFDLPAPNPGPIAAGRGLCSEDRPALLTNDIDGDGTPDLVFRAFDGWKALRYSLSAEGSAQVPKLEVESIGFEDWAGSETGNGLMVGDFNGDGLYDVWGNDVGSDHDHVGNLWINQGNRTYRRTWVHHPRPALDVLPPPVRHMYSAVLDYNADGLMDLLESWEGARTPTGGGTFRLNPQRSPQRSREA